MLSLNITGALGSTITPSKGIPDQELTALRTGLRRYVVDFVAEREKGLHPWAMDPYDRKTLEAVKNAATTAMTEDIQTIIWIGIGGSGLGPKVIQEAYESPDTLEFILLDTIDPSMLSLTLRIVDFKRTLVIVASKSGDTLEPMSAFFLCFSKLREALGERASSRVIAITDPHQGALRGFCLEHGIRMLPVPPDVGGRFSIFTSIGLLPMALLRGNVDRFLVGAREFDALTKSTSLEENPAALLAGIQYLLDMKRGYPVRVIMPYAQRIASIARWDQQLIAESLGKTETNNPVPLAALGTQDQHSLLQQWMAGPRRAWHIFIRERESMRLPVPETIDPAFEHLRGKTYGELLDACYEGTSRALTAAKRPHVTITLPTLDEYHLGQLFFLFLTEVVLLGKLYRIDPYGQPGVELGKKITKAILLGEDVP